MREKPGGWSGCWVAEEYLSTVQLAQEVSANLQCSEVERNRASPPNTVIFHVDTFLQFRECPQGRAYAERANIAVEVSKDRNYS
mmetsp:Transcript_36884/g.147324  ORF Transcript_36884/g.147324 Transcript_36884/m.147324 type:complete len:84 (-) Transcript_36884:1374-1625(-)